MEAELYPIYTNQDEIIRSHVRIRAFRGMFNYLLYALTQVGLERVDFFLESLCSSVQAQPLIEGSVQ
jgi:hypothetical protein